MQRQAGSFSTSGRRGYFVAKGDLGVNMLKGLANLLSISLKKSSSRLADNMLPMG